MSMRKKLLPPGGNLFQTIKAQIAAAREKGINVINLSIGQPSGPAFLEARAFAAQAILSGEESMHEYQDNGSPGCPGFAERFSSAHWKVPDPYFAIWQKDYLSLRKFYADKRNIDFLPIPGIKPMLPVVINSCGGYLGGEGRVAVLTMTRPGYPTPAEQAKIAKGVIHECLSVDPENFLFVPVDELETNRELKEGDLVMLNFPHNPTGQIATRDFWREVCAVCERKGLRVFNDGAYIKLAYDNDSFALADVAVEFPDLNWVEAYSASKAGNFCGWRIGAMAGSKEFISDIRQIKGETDSGFNAALACGVDRVFMHAQYQIDLMCDLYQERTNDLAVAMISRGLKIAVTPRAGFFVFFHCPNQAFGVDIADAKEFNALMIERTGLAGVPFGKYIRYSVAYTAIEQSGVLDQIASAIDDADVVY